MRRRVRRAVTAVVVAAGMAGVLVASTSSIELPAAAGQVVPGGFWWTDIETGLGDGDLLTDFDYLPDGSVISLGKNGKIAWAAADGKRTRVLATLPAVTANDAGLVGIEVAHDYETSSRIYLSIAEPNDDAEGFTWLVGTWEVTGADEPDGLNRTGVVLEIPGNSFVHGFYNVIDQDGTLWIGMGDNANFVNADPYSLRVQDLNQPNGKIMRVTPDGAGVPDNPFYDAADPASWRSRVYAYGFRNPYRFTIDERNGALIVGDVGWSRWEWLNYVRPGGNYGWPCWEANEQTIGHRDAPECAGVTREPPLWVYGREAGASVTGGLIYTGDSYPEKYRGAYFFGDYHSSRIWTMKFDDEGNIVRPPEIGGFANDVGGPVRFRLSPEGDLVFGDIFTGKLRRLDYAEGNRPPAATIATDVDASTRTVRFDASGSADLDEDVLTYTWDFGDGATGTGMRAKHTYAADVDTVTARLTVTDRGGAADTTSVDVAPGNFPPELTMSTPAPGVEFAVGDPVELGATATDPEDGELDVRWTTTLKHCRGEICHAHYGEESTGPGYREDFPNHEDNSHLEITATATDSHGVSASQTFRARPQLRKIVLDSNVAAELSVNGTVTREALIIVNATVSFAAAETDVDGDLRFVGWSDQGPRARAEFTMPDEDIVLTATYR